MYNLIISMLLLLGSVGVTHDIHLSICDLKYNTSTSSIQITLRVFLDDLESTLSRDTPEELKILTRYESPQADSLINIYIHRHLNIQVDGKLYDMHYVGKEISEDYLAMWAYFEISNINSLKALEIKNDILMELYDDQQNIVTIKKDREKISHWLFDSKRNKNSVNL